MTKFKLQSLYDYNHLAFHVGYTTIWLMKKLYLAEISTSSEKLEVVALRMNLNFWVIYQIDINRNLTK